MKLKQTARKSTSGFPMPEWLIRMLVANNQMNARENVRPSWGHLERPDEDSERVTSSMSRRTRPRAMARKSTGPAALVQLPTGSKMVRKNPKDEVSPNKRSSRSSCRPKGTGRRNGGRDDDDDDDNSDSGPGSGRRSPPRLRSHQRVAIKLEGSKSN